MVPGSPVINDLIMLGALEMQNKENASPPKAKSGIQQSLVVMGSVLLHGPHSILNTAITLTKWLTRNALGVP